MTNNKSIEKIRNLIKTYDSLVGSKNTKALSKWFPLDLIDMTSFLPEGTPVKIRIWHLKNNTWCIPTCKLCNAITKFDFDDKCYRVYCSKRCSANDSSVKEKKANSILSKYGSTNYFHTDDYKNKAKQTNKSRYGAEYAASSSIVRNRIEKTNVEKYGVKSTLSVPSVKQKIEKTNLERYGVDNASKSNIVKEKIRAANKLVDQDAVIQRRRQTNIEKYGRLDPAQRHISLENLDLSYNKEWLELQHSQYPIVYIAKKLGITSSVLSNRFKILGIKINHHNISYAHRKIIDWLQLSYNGKIIVNDRTTLDGFELDILLPDKNIAIEIDGIYWHGEVNGNKNKFYHLNKTNKCIEKNIKLIHIWENEIVNKWEIVKSRLQNVLNLSKKIGARQLIVKSVHSNVARRFHIDNHLNGYSPAKIHVGLFDKNNQLLMCMSIGKSRFLKTPCLEIIRMASINGYTVIGGISKLLSHLKTLNLNQRLITYADKKWGNGHGYAQSGFSYIKDTAPGYWYVNGLRVYHRSNFQKCKLKNILENFNNSLSEWENMKNNNWDRIWDCGNTLWHMTI